jgi:hypothetical protein
MTEWNSSLAGLVATACVGCVVIVAISFTQRARARRAVVRRGIAIKWEGARPVDDLIVECLWRTTISVTNQSRAPRQVPVLASRATVAAGRKVYLGSVFLERELLELNPDEVAVIWVDYLLPAGTLPRRVELSELRVRGDDRRVRLRPAAHSRRAGALRSTSAGYPLPRVNTDAARVELPGSK